MRQYFYQKGWFKNTILIGIPSLISVIGVIISIIQSQLAKIVLVTITIFLMIGLAIAVIFFSNQEDKINKECNSLKDQNIKLLAILAHMENNYKTSVFTISTFSELMETWAKTINSFANNVKSNGTVSDKAWDKIRLFDSICLYCKNMIKQYCNQNEDSKISVSFVSCKVDKNGEKWVHMVAHSNPESIRPNACKGEERLSECIYHYAELIKQEYTDVEIAINNEEIQRIFKKISKTTDLNKYTQYIAIPVYCTSKKLLGMFQVVTKHGYIIENDKVKLEQFVTEHVIPYSNLIILIDKIYKGLYISPVQINKED